MARFDQEDNAAHWEAYFDNIADLVMQNQTATMSTASAQEDPSTRPQFARTSVPPVETAYAPSPLILHGQPDQQLATNTSAPEHTFLGNDLTSESTVLPDNTTLQVEGGQQQEWAFWAHEDTVQPTPVLTAAGSQFTMGPQRSEAYTRNCGDDIFHEYIAVAHSGTPDHNHFTVEQHDTPMMDQFAHSNYVPLPMTVHGDFFPDLEYNPELGQDYQELAPPPNFTSNPEPSQPARSVGTVHQMQGWLRRASSFRDRALPRVKTSHLVPPAHTVTANASPTSASTTGSSRFSARRSRQQMTLGQHSFTCDICDAGFDAQGELTHHRRCHQPYLQRRHVCQHCHKRFQYRKDLTRHLLQHDPNAPRYYCPHRGCRYAVRGFGRQDHLERHQNSQHRLRADTPQQE